MKREYWKNEKSEKWKTLKKLFSKMKKSQFSKMFSDLMETAKKERMAQWFNICKKIGFINKNLKGIKVECLECLPEVKAADRVATHFASISQGYQQYC